MAICAKLADYGTTELPGVEYLTGGQAWVPSLRGQAKTGNNKKTQGEKTGREKQKRVIVVVPSSCRSEKTPCKVSLFPRRARTPLFSGWACSANTDCPRPFSMSVLVLGVLIEAQIHIAIAHGCASLVPLVQGPKFRSHPVSWHGCARRGGHIRWTAVLGAVACNGGGKCGECAGCW